MATTDEQYIQKMYDNQKESTMNTLRTAYDANVSSLNAAKSSADTQAYDAKREAAGNAAITRQRLNETFAANGLNTGAVGQANLALLNQKAANLNDIETERVAAQTEYDRQKALLEQEYQAEVKNAILENDAARAEALYKLYQQQTAGRSYSSGSYSGGSAGGTAKSGDFIDGGSAGGNANSGSGSAKQLPSKAEISAAQKQLYLLREAGQITDTEYLLANADLPRAALLGGTK